MVEIHSSCESTKHTFTSKNTSIFRTRVVVKHYLLRVTQEREEIGLAGMCTVEAILALSSHLALTNITPDTKGYHSSAKIASICSLLAFDQAGRLD
jgi:hypothetical protein